MTNRYFFSRPNKLDLEAMYNRQNKENLEIAFNFAEKEFNVTKLLDAEGE